MGAGKGEKRGGAVSDGSPLCCRGGASAPQPAGGGEGEKPVHGAVSLLSVCCWIAWVTFCIVLILQLLKVINRLDGLVVAGIHPSRA